MDRQEVGKRLELLAFRHLRIYIFHTHLFIQQASIETQCVAGIKLGPGNPMGEVPLFTPLLLTLSLPSRSHSMAPSVKSGPPGSMPLPHCVSVPTPRHFTVITTPCLPHSGRRGLLGHRTCVLFITLCPGARHRAWHTAGA
jgi:hypothetical protein